MHLLTSLLILWGVIFWKTVRSGEIIDTYFPYLYNNVYNIRAVTIADGLLLEGPQWSESEQVLYYVDKYGQKIYRYDPVTGERQERNIGYGPTSLVIPVRNEPGVLLVAVRTGLYLLEWGAPGGDLALKQISNVDLGKPDNIINDGKCDETGRLWFGTMGKLIGPDVVPDQATFYSLSYTNVANPYIQLRPVSLSNGVAFSSNNKYLYYNDSPTRQVVRFDFDIEKGQIANKTVLFDFDDYNLIGVPDGMTIDVNDNLYVATFRGASILKIDSYTGALLDIITLPVDQVSSVIFGGENYSKLYATTAKRFVNNPKSLSGALFEIDVGAIGKPEPTFLFPNARQYCNTDW